MFEKFFVDKWKDKASHYRMVIATSNFPHTIPICDAEKRLWCKVYHYEGRIYRYEQKQWYRKTKQILKAAHPYGAFQCLPEILFAMVERCYEYWHHGYDIHAEESYVAPIREQVAHAYELVKKCRLAMDSEMEYPNELLVELFTYVGQHVNEWDD